MSFSGYPDGEKAVFEMRRVLKPEGKLVIIDVNYPADGNKLGIWLTGLWKRIGDIIRDMDDLFNKFDISYSEKEIGGWGSVHLYVVSKRESSS